MNFSFLIDSLTKFEAPFAVAYVALLTLSHLRNSHLSDRSRNVLGFYLNNYEVINSHPDRSEIIKNLKCQSSKFVERYKDVGRISQNLLISLGFYAFFRSLLVITFTLNDKKFDLVSGGLLAICILIIFYMAILAFKLISDMKIGGETLDKNEQIFDFFKRKIDKSAVKD